MNLSLGVYGKRCLSILDYPGLQPISLMSIKEFREKELRKFNTHDCFDD
jgi:hypothetical protein